MAKEEKSKTTVGIYLRSLRAIFNKAIEEGNIIADIYPFKKYKIPTGQNIKKALDKLDLKTLYTAELERGSAKEKARDFWFFSYQCNGMNFRDIAELKYKDINRKSFSFLRHKTLHTTKDKPRPIIVPLTESIKAIIERYGTKPVLPENYMFPILEKLMNETEKLRVNQNFIRFVNQHIQKLAKDLELDTDISRLIMPFAILLLPQTHSPMALRWNWYRKVWDIIACQPHKIIGLVLKMMLNKK